MLSTTIIFPINEFTIDLYSSFVFTKSLASPKTPFSVKTSLKFVLSTLPILLIGRNVALPYLFFLRYSINRLAVSSLSMTIFCILLPSAVSIAVS